MFVTASIIANSLFLIGAPCVEYDIGDFKKFGARKVSTEIPDSKLVNHKCRVMAFGIYAGYHGCPVESRMRI